MVLPDNDPLKPALYQGFIEGFQVCGLLLDEILQFIDAGNLCIPGSSGDGAFFSLFSEFEDLVGNLIIGLFVELPRIVRPKNLTIERGSFFVVKYSFKFKLYAVKLYLSTEGSYQELAKLEFLLLRYYGYRSLNINNNFKESAF